LSRAAATAVAAPACVRCLIAIARDASTPSRRCEGTSQDAACDFEQERRVAVVFSVCRAVLEARFDGGHDAPRHAVAVTVRHAAERAPRLVAGLF